MGAATMRLIKLSSLIFTLSFAFLSQGAISVSLDVESLKAAGAANASSGILVLVVSQDDNDFSLPEAGSIVPAGSDDAIVTIWDLADQSLPDDDFTLLSKAISYDAGWAAGDPLGLYWFPNLTAGNPVPSANEEFGFFADTTNVQSGDDWSLPADGALLHSLKLFTSDADELVSGGPSPNGVAISDFAIGQPVAVQSPTSVSGEANSGNSVTVNWQGGTAPGGGFLIERRLAGSGSYTTIGIADSDDGMFIDNTVEPEQSYEYRVTAFNSFGSQFSSIIALNTPEGASTAIVNLSTRGILGDGNNVMISGFIIGGEGTLTVLSRSVGPSIVKSGVSTDLASPDPKSDLFSTVSASNDDWEDDDGSLISALSSQVGAQPDLDPGSKDSAFAISLGAGGHAVISSDNQTNDKLGLVEIYDANETGPGLGSARLVNLSTRGFIGTGDAIMIGGLVIGGEGSMRILIRGIGPNLDGLSENEILADPVLQLLDLGNGGALLEANDNWQDSNGPAIAAAADAVFTPQFANGSTDSAILRDLESGTYGIFLLGANGGTGIGQIEIWEVPQ